MKFIKRGKIFEARDLFPWWKSHTMAPSAVRLNENKIRVYIGCWDNKGISRIGYIDVDAEDPSKIIKISEHPVLDLGVPGTFDDNGVFPAHVNKIGDKIFLYYTGFQLGLNKITHFNFGGLALSGPDGEIFKKVSLAPVLDRKDEGLLVRAGQSVLLENGIYRTVYSAGSSWVEAGGKMRPTYDIYYQESKDGFSYAGCGKKILEYNRQNEHGLGRPQLVMMAGNYYIFYTRRMLDMKYYFGCAVSSDCISWQRIDMEIEGIPHSAEGWDSEMIYFPSVLVMDEKILMFYSGNGFGKTGIGFAEIIL